MPDDSQAPQVSEKRRQMDAVLRRFAEAQEARPDSATLRPPPPRRLHHYTNLSGLVGITSSGTIWASDVRFVNDASELSYAADLILRVVTEVVEESDIVKPFIHQHSGLANPFEYGQRPFVACFCEEGDLLSQWRAYRGGETSYSLGFDLHVLSASADLPPRTYLRKVVYAQDQQEELVRGAAQTWVQTAVALIESAGLQPEDLFPYPAIWALQEALAEHHLCFKNPAFAEEKEWRLIKLVDVREELRLLENQRLKETMTATRERMQALGVDVDIPEIETAWGEAKAEGVDIRFREAPIGLVPYVPLLLRDTAGVFTGKLPLWEVMQGPSPNPDLSLESLRMYLESRGYGFHTELNPSAIPLRV